VWQNKIIRFQPSSVVVDRDAKKRRKKKKKVQGTNAPPTSQTQTERVEVTRGSDGSRACLFNRRGAFFNLVKYKQ